MKAITLDARPWRWLACKALGTVWPGVFWSRLSNLRYREVAEPELPGPEWVRLRTRLGGVCGTDLALIRQRTHPASILRPYTSFPIVLGHENVATVEVAGPQAGEWPAGTRVVVEPALSCVPRGVMPPCAACSAGLFALCTSYLGGNGLPAGTMLGLNAFTGGSWAPRFVAHRSQLHAVPDAISDEQAVLIDPLACSLHAVLRRPPAPQERVLIQGSGIIAIGVALALRALGYANVVVALCRHSYQAERFAAAGVTRMVSASRRRPREGVFDELAEALGTRRVSSIFGNHALLRGADVVYECTGTGQGLSDAIKCAAARGTVVAAGTSQITLVDTTCVWFREVSVVGAYGRQVETVAGRREHTYAVVMELMGAGRLSTAGLLSKVFPAREYRAALAALGQAARGRLIKVALKPE